MSEQNLSFFSEIKRIKTQIGLPKIYRYLAVIKRLDKTVTGSGFSVNEEQSIMGAMGEAIERYCASIEPNTKKEAEDKIEKIQINSITRASTKYDYVSKRKWTEVQELTSLEEKLVPIELVYLYKVNYPPIRDIISTGLAAYITLEGAVTRGLCECIERDAFMLFWMLSQINFKVNIHTIDKGEIKILINKAYNSGLELEVYDISTEFEVPVILTITKKRGKEGFYISCAANFDYDMAIKKSLEEGLGGYSVYSEATLVHNHPIPDDLSKVKNLSERPIYYLNKNQDELLSDIIERSGIPIQPKNYNDIRKEKPTLNKVIRLLNKNKINVYFKDLTTPDVCKLGYKVARVITPELAFLPIGEPMLYCNRLIQKSQELDRNYSSEE